MLKLFRVENGVCWHTYARVVCTTEGHIKLDPKGETAANIAKATKYISTRITEMPTGARLVLLIPGNIFFNTIMYNFLLSFALERSKYIGTDKTIQNDTLHRDDMLRELRVHSDFMQVFIAHYIHPMYKETEAVVAKRSQFFFNIHQAKYDRVPRGEFFMTCIQGATVHAPIHGQLMMMQSGADVMPRSVPTIVQFDMDIILHLVRTANTHLTQYLQDCIQLQKFAHYDPQMLPQPRSIEGSVSIRDILREIVHVVVLSRRRWSCTHIIPT